MTRVGLGFYQSILHLNRLRELGTFSQDSDRLIGWYCSKITFDFIVGVQVALLNELVVMDLLVGERERDNKGQGLGGENKFLTPNWKPFFFFRI